MLVYIFLRTLTHNTHYNRYYGVASVSRIDKIIGLFCKRALYKRRYSAKKPVILSTY